MQQLDLFGSFEPAKPAGETPVKKEKAKPAAKPLPAFLSKPFTPQAGELPVAAPAVDEAPALPVAIQAKPAANGKRGRKSFKDMDAEIDMVEVPDDDVLFQKQYYTMREVSAWFHVNQSLIRYWENEFDILKPRKNRKGDRLFRPEDVRNLQLIYHLLRQQKMSIEGARQYLKEHKHKADMQVQLIQSLTKLRAFLLEWKSNLGA